MENLVTFINIFVPISLGIFMIYILYKEKDIISDLKEDNKLLLSKIEVYKEEITKLKNKLEYAQRFFVLYENIMENSRKENKQLTEKIKELENQIKLNKKD